MSPKTTPTEQTAELVNVITPRVLPIKRDQSPVLLHDILNTMGLGGPHIPADQLIDSTFTILGAKQFASAYPTQDHAYFVIAKDNHTGELFQTVLGGSACVEILDALVEAGFDKPLTVTLRKKEGGRFGGYYVLE